MCGIMIEVGLGDHGKRETCETCHRRFDIRISSDAPAGQRSVSLHYLAGEDHASGSATTIVPISGPKKPGPENEILEPEPPAEALVKCGCGELLAVFRKQYEKRGRCPACGARMLVFMLYDASARSYTLQTFSLVDRESGSTQLLTKL
jgi:hypothetical protein